MYIPACMTRQPGKYSPGEKFRDYVLEKFEELSNVWWKFLKD